MKKDKDDDDDDWEYDDDDDEFYTVKEISKQDSIKKEISKQDSIKKEISKSDSFEKWKNDRIDNQICIDYDTCLKTAGFIDSDTKQEIDENQECPICYLPIEPGNRTILPCGCIFGTDCIELHIQTQFLDGQSSLRIHCPNIGCFGIIFPSMIRNFLQKCKFPEEEMKGRKMEGNRAVEQYNYFLQENYIESQKGKMCYCANPRCQYVVKRLDLLRVDIRCICGQSFCFTCRRDSHVPATCNMMEKWEKMTKSESANIKWIQANTKQCPFQIEKNGGCFCMTCSKCHKQFCWVCCKDWSTHPDHFKCNTPPDEIPSQQESAKAKQELDYDRFYYERVIDQKKALQFAQKQLDEAHLMIQRYIKLIKCNEETAQFIRECALTLVRCREFIMHSYILAYCLPKSPQKQLFELQQGSLLASTEMLCKIQEGKIEDLERDKMMHFSQLSKHHLDSLIEFSASDQQEFIQQIEGKLNTDKV
ncbi:MAG: putative ubiquitin-conjugating enzyme E2-binding protein 1 [Streblomastix strix]|uniref:RBR-type E3 ubiquitin transferase n=1 Tax=Streblomastix strix TaxID=222440 RepID=A0A5J4WI84_9EUKA|nr:MAG: putative ubiquitin-conjugating enzyme E2-binding protein 1 [Streblomastix strix]